MVAAHQTMWIMPALRASLRGVYTHPHLKTQHSYNFSSCRPLSSNAMLFPHGDSDVYWPEDGVENLEGYCPGGYHPTHINDQLSDNRYTIIHKLGFGPYSTVWLARDREADRYVALKIVAAHGSKTNHESDILAHLQAGDTSHPGRQYISSLLDVFSFHGPNGQHTCLVSEVARCTAAESKENSPDFMFPLATARSIAAQVSLGLAYMHSRSVGHGDLHCRNILLQTTGMGVLTVPEIYERFGEPFHVPISRADKLPTGPEAPSYAVTPMNLIVPSHQITSCKVKITDFGSSFLFGEIPKTLHTPTALLPPEAFFHEPVSEKADIWTLACTLYDILGERPLFETWADDPDDVIGEMVSTLGRLPTRWWEKWEKRPEFSSPMDGGIRSLTGSSRLGFDRWSSDSGRWGGVRRLRYVSSVRMRWRAWGGCSGWCWYMSRKSGLGLVVLSSRSFGALGVGCS